MYLYTPNGGNVGPSVGSPITCIGSTAKYAKLWYGKHQKVIGFEAVRFNPTVTITPEYESQQVSRIDKDSGIKRE